MCYSPAVALVLLPKSVAYVSQPLAIATYFVLDGMTFFALERALGLRRRESPQLLATLLDYAPESLALGGVFASGVPGAPMLAVLIGLQNLPEGFNAYRELMSVKGAHSRRILLGMSMLVPIGPILAILGLVFPFDTPTSSWRDHGLRIWRHLVSGVPGHCPTIAA